MHNIDTVLFFGSFSTLFTEKSGKGSKEDTTEKSGKGCKDITLALALDPLPLL